MSNCVIQNVVKHLPHYTVSHYMVTAFRISNSTIQNKVKEFNTQNVFMYMYMFSCNFFTPQLARFPVNENTLFQQDGATSHTARMSMNAVNALFPRSPDLTPCDYFL
jgi:hypothetical protein